MQPTLRPAHHLPAVYLYRDPIDFRIVTQWVERTHRNGTWTQPIQRPPLCVYQQTA